MSSLFSKHKHTEYVCILCIRVSVTFDVWIAVRTGLQNSVTITSLLPSSVQLHHNPFIFWVKKHSSQTNTITHLHLSCKNQPRLSSWHSPDVSDIFLAQRKPFIHLRLGRGAKDIHCLLTQKAQQSSKTFYPPASEIRRQSGTGPLLLLY